MKKPRAKTGKRYKPFWLVYIFTFFVRLGEASKPGPEPGCIIGCINPTGLLHKAHVIAELPKATTSIWAVSESHLTKAGMPKFNSELKRHQTGLHLHPGAPVPARSSTISAIGGKHRGVAFLANVPGRALTPTWEAEEWNKSRFHVAGFAAGQRWISGGVVYGHAAHPESLATRSLTNQICSHVTTRLIDHATGLRFITGDFNQPDGALQSMQKWADLGWVNVQSWAAQVLNKPIQYTCKNKTTKDHLFVSPELAMYLLDVEVDNTWFPDHAILYAKFKPLGSPPMLPLWKKPKPIDWQNIKNEELENEFHHNDDLSSDMTCNLRNLFQDVEQAVETLTNKKGQPMHASSKGRAQTLEVKWVREYTAPVKQGRQGEYQPQFHGACKQHAQWLRQYRRMVNLHQLVTANKQQDTAQQHKQNLWKAIRTAPGFQPNFLTWWEMQGGPNFPAQVPTKEVLEKICENFHHHLATFEKQLTSKKIQAAKQKRVEDPMLIFQDLRKEPIMPVQVLVNRTSARVTAIDQDESALLIHPPCVWEGDKQIYGPQGPLPVIHGEADKIWVEDVTGIQVGSELSQEEYIGNLPSLFAQFAQEWQARWDRHLETPEERWNPITSFAEQVLPRPEPMPYNPITVDEWRSALKKKSRKSAIGPDGISKNDLLNLPYAATERLLQLFYMVEQGAKWPEQLMVGFVVALEKVRGATTTGQFRPITVFPLCYRIWGSIRAKQILLHLQQLAPSTCAGNLPGRHAGHVWYTIMREIENAQFQGTSLSGGGH